VAAKDEIFEAVTCKLCGESIGWNRPGDLNVQGRLLHVMHGKSRHVLLVTPARSAPR
jgi:hypothetical protein